MTNMGIGLYNKVTDEIKLKENIHSYKILSVEAFLLL
jgi:hypothetical protein